MITFNIVDYWHYNSYFPKNKILKDETEEYVGDSIQNYIIKNILEDKEELRNIINKYIDNDISTIKNVKSKDLEKYKLKLFTNNLKIDKTNIIYKIKGKNIFILIKYTHTIDYKMAEKMTKYCIDIIRSLGEQIKMQKIYPVILPIVVYTGRKKWDALTTLNKIEDEYYGFPPVEYPKYNLVNFT